MRETGRRLASALMGLTMLASPISAAPRGAGVTVRVHDGVLRGVAAANSDVLAYKGIPYARPPVGDLRFRAPEPALAWAGVRDAGAFGHPCIQPPGAPGGLYYEKLAPTSENCLTLNVWVPAHARKLPVMVWIHGGSLVGGSSSEPLYNGTPFAERGIVFVSINYRVGVLGFLAHPALGVDTPGHLSGNYGLLDQIAALRWVHDNIAGLGGDPTRVTVAGESAGALSVMALMTSPLARGLFHQAISESGYMPAYRALHASTLGQPSAEAAGEALGKAAGLATAAQLRAADPATLFKAGLTTGWQPEPVIDGHCLPRQIADGFMAGEQAKVPVLAGFNEGEIRSLLFLMPPAPATQAAYVADVRRRFGGQAAAYLSVYPGADPRADVMASVRDGLYGWAAQTLVRSQAAAGQQAYLYYFRHGTSAERARDLAAFHASELPYVFGQVGANAPWGPNWPRPPLTGAEERLADAMVGYWTSFVRTGTPVAPDEPAWPRFTAAGRPYLDIDEAPVARRDLHPGAFAWADALVDAHRRQGVAWRLNMGFLSFPEPADGSVDAWAAQRHR